MSSIETKSYSATITLMYLESADLSCIDTALHEKLANTPPDFFTATPIVADISRIPPNEAIDLSALIPLFQRHKLSLVGISGEKFSDEEISAHGLAKFEINDIRQATRSPIKTEPSSEAPSTPSASPAQPNQNPQNKTLRTNVRSGQRVYAPGGDLTIIGTVGAGAEVIADGNIYILGSLRGRAFAGAQGNDETHIFANDFQAELVSIAGNYQNHEQLSPYRGGKNCLVTLNKDETMLIVSL